MTTTVKLLSMEEEVSLAKRVASGLRRGRPLGGDGLAARNELVMRNVGLVHDTVNRLPRFMKRNLQDKDLEQEGYRGLIQAAESYDPAKEVRFSTYARYWIKKTIYIALTTQTRLIQVPWRSQQRLSKWRAMAVQMAREGAEPTPQEIGDRLGLSSRQIDLVMDSIRCSENIGREFDLEDHRAEDTHKRDDETPPIGQIIEECPLLPHEREVLAMRYGQNRMTLKEIGSKMRCTSEWVRKLEARAINKIREHVRLRDRESEKQPT